MTSFQTERCSHAGATCLKSATIDVKVDGIHESVSLIKNVKPNTRDLKKITLTDQFLFTTLDVVDAGIHLFWDKKTWLYVKLDEKWQNKASYFYQNHNEDHIISYDVSGGRFMR